MTRHSKPATDQGLLPVAAIVLEQTLGHVTHSKNLQALVPQVGGVDPVFLPVAFDPGERRIPGWSNWTVRAGIRGGAALLALRRRRPAVRPDVMFVHTQVPAVLLGPWMRRTPTIVSIDATPKQYDELGEFYAHEQGPAWLERRKFRANQRCFERAAHMVAWSAWSQAAGWSTSTASTPITSPSSRPASTSINGTAPANALPPTAGRCGSSSSAATSAARAVTC